jgi:hypothetical protein
VGFLHFSKSVYERPPQLGRANRRQVRALSDNPSEQIGRRDPDTQAPDVSSEDTAEGRRELKQPSGAPPGGVGVAHLTDETEVHQGGNGVRHRRWAHCKAAPKGAPT